MTWALFVWNVSRHVVQLCSCKSWFTSLNPPQSEYFLIGGEMPWTFAEVPKWEGESNPHWRFWRPLSHCWTTLPLLHFLGFGAHYTWSASIFSWAAALSCRRCAHGYYTDGLWAMRCVNHNKIIFGECFFGVSVGEILIGSHTHAFVKSDAMLFKRNEYGKSVPLDHGSLIPMRIHTFRCSLSNVFYLEYLEFLCLRLGPVLVLLSFQALCMGAVIQRIPEHLLLFDQDQKIFCALLFCHRENGAVSLRGIEPPTFGSVNQRSILSYGEQSS